jgi:nitroreductase
MEFLELAKNRYSCRSYLKKEVEEEKIIKVLEAARIAPSAKNLQPWHFVIVDEEDNISEIRDCYNGRWIDTAPMIIVACGDQKAAWHRSDGKNHMDIDLSIAIDHMTLAASDNGLATCWVCKFDVMEVAQILQLPDGVIPVAMIPIGYPADQADIDRHKHKRRSLPEIVHKGKFYYKYFKK